MKIYLVGRPDPSWMRSGYGCCLLEAQIDLVLVSFVQFVIDPKIAMITHDMPTPYVPNIKELPNEDISGNW